MKKIGTVVVIILPGILVLAVVFAGIVSGFRFIPGSGREKKECQFNCDVEDLKMFKTKAITVFMVVQFFMAFSVWIVKFIEF